MCTGKTRRGRGPSTYVCAYAPHFYPNLTHLAALSKERETLRGKRGSLLALLKSTQALLQQQNARVAALKRAQLTAKALKMDCMRLPGQLCWNSDGCRRPARRSDRAPEGHRRMFAPPIPLDVGDTSLERKQATRYPSRTNFGYRAFSVTELPNLK